MIIKEMEGKGLKFPEAADPLLFLEPRPGQTKSQAFMGLRQAIQDTLEDMKEMGAHKLQEIDALLKNEGAPSLSEVRSIIWNEIPKIMKRGRIKNDTEFYLIKERTINIASNEFTDQELQLLNRLLEEYEFRRK